MFYAEIIDYLRSVSTITNTVTTFAGAPSIFSIEAPEKAERPYITLHIDAKKTPDSTVVFGDLYIDYWDFNKSRVVANTLDQALENALDTMKLTAGDRLLDIRFDLGSSGHVEDSDPRNIHFNAIYSFRGIRSRWMIETK